MFVGLAVMCAGVIGSPRAADAASADERAAAAMAPSVRPAEAQSRPRALVPLYVSFAALQGLDVHSTLRAVEVGRRETNPIVAGMVGSPAAFVAAKAGITAGICFASERLWKRNKTAAVLTMIALNSAYGAVVAHNYAVAAGGAPDGGR